jgi:hypothetical protein
MQGQQALVLMLVTQVLTELMALEPRLAILV